jgi:signal transduction histidine kinase
MSTAAEPAVSDPAATPPPVPASRRILPEHWLRTDVIIAGVLAVAAVEMVYLGQWSGMDAGYKASVHVVAATGAAAALLLAFRRRAPLTVALLYAGAYIVLASWVGIELYASQVMLFMSFYTVGAWSPDRRKALWVRVAIVAAMATWLLIVSVLGFSAPQTGERGVNAYFAFLLIQWLVNAAYFTGAWMFGNRAWQQALERQQLERAHAEIHAQQAQLAEQAVSLERVRIARELHDVVAHHVTAMGVQAGAARLLQAKDPEAAAGHLKAVEDSSRQAVRELQTLVHTLRDDDGSVASVPRLSDLESLAEDARSAGGQRVVLERVGPAPQLPPAAELALYRVAQEGLTNARKHAGPRAAVTLRLRTEAGRVELEVSDDGRAGRGLPRAAGTRMGLRGMRERMDSVGGTVDAGPKPTGGWLVRATVPAGAPARESAATLEETL